MFSPLSNKSVVQLLSDSAEKMRCAPSCMLACVVDEGAHLPRVLVNHRTKTGSTMHLVLTAVLRCPLSLKSYGIDILVSSHI